MTYEPLTQEQFKKARAAGFTPAKIVEMEKKRKADSSISVSTPTKEPGLLEKVGNFVAPSLTRTIGKISSGEGGVGLRDIAGSALEVGSLLIPAGAGVRALGLGAKGLKALTAAQRIGAGAATGALSGGASGAGRSIGEEGDFGQVVGSTLGGAGLGALGGGIIPPAAGALSKIPSAIGIGAKNTITRAAPTVEQKMTSAAGKIVQGTTDEARRAAKTFSTINTQGVTTYKELSDRIGTQLKSKLEGVNKEFDSDTTVRKLKDLAQTITVGEGKSTLTGKANYVEDAIKQLSGHYNAINDMEGALKIRALMQKAQKQGLTPTEINNLAKEHGRVLRGFNANGELASGLTKQASENTRKGLKSTARGFLKTDAAKLADEEASNLIATKELVDDMVEKVNKLSQRVETRNIVQRAARAAGSVVNIATLGGPKAFVTKLLFPSGVGQKTMTSLDLQEALAKNLQLLQRIEKAQPAEAESLIKQLLSGASAVIPKKR